MALLAENIITFLQESLVNWETELTSCGETLGLVDIRPDIFQGDSLFLLIFALCMVPLTKILQNVKAGYTLQDVKINHLFFMDDLKVYGKIKAEIESLVWTVQLISQDVGMEFGIRLERGKLCKKLDKEREMKDIFRIEYLRRLKLVMKSQLNSKNKVKAANTWAVSLIRYGAGTIKWNEEELQEIGCLEKS
ncbi:uncharacterized protein [Montipora foliosa]|uniref:uncharacterized protein n=1 Tax=Montipora foliosa TaxID=591990 RepID=UPI0035F1953D